MLEKVISGGQTGADEAGLFVANKFGLETGGWMPKGFRTLGGPKPEFAELYGVQEHTSKSYVPRTRLNVQDSDGTIRIACIWKSPGERCTLKAIRDYQKPYFDIKIVAEQSYSDVAEWIKNKDIKTLNVAGPRASKDPKIYQKVSYIIEGVYYLGLVKAIISEIMTTDPLIVEDFVKEIVSELSFKERATIAHMDEEDVELLQDVFNMYIKSKTGVESDDHYEYTVIMKMLWEKLRKTHKLRVVK